MRRAGGRLIGDGGHRLDAIVGVGAPSQVKR